MTFTLLFIYLGKKMSLFGSRLTNANTIKISVVILQNMLFINFLILSIYIHILDISEQNTFLLKR